jgi:hypothetical protein
VWALNALRVSVVEILISGTAAFTDALARRDGNLGTFIPSLDEGAMSSLKSGLALAIGD